MRGWKKIFYVNGNQKKARRAHPFPLTPPATALVQGADRTPGLKIKPHKGREQKQEELQSCRLWNKNHIHRKIDKMKGRELHNRRRNKIKPQKNN